MLQSEKKRKLFFRIAVIAPFILILLLFSGQIVYISYFNKQVYSVSGIDETSQTYLDMEPRDDSTSFWLKRDFEWEGNTIDLKAQTIDGVLLNNAPDTINRWMIRIDIKGDCFINNAWCGTMEIHQHAGTPLEKVQTLDLRKYNIDEVALDYLYDGDLLIPLEEGDYIFYYPSEADDEVPISGNSELTMGIIFYYFDSLDFYDYTLEFSYHRLMTQGAAFYVIVGIGILWLIGIAVSIASQLIYKDAKKQMETKRSALSCLSDIYQSIYIVDLPNNTLTPVIEKLSEELERPDSLSASEQIRNLFETDAKEEYKETMLDFCDLSKLPERLKDRQSIAGEYESKLCGWCCIRFFAMDQIEGRELDRVIFTIQIIDTERREMAHMTEQITRAKQEIRVGAAFLESLSDEMDAPVQSILKAEAKQDLPRIRHEAAKLESKINDMRDYACLQSGQTGIENAMFSLSALLEDCMKAAEESLKDSPVVFETDFGPELPERISGDRKNLARVLGNLVETASMHTEEGSIRLSVFAKMTEEEKVHLLFSVRDTGDGNRSGTNREVGILLAEGLLLKMQSELHIIHTPGRGTESYFELETETAGSSR